MYVLLYHIETNYTTFARKQVIVWYLCSNYYYCNGLSNRRPAAAAQRSPCVKPIPHPLPAGPCPLRAWSGSFLGSFCPNPQIYANGDSLSHSNDQNNIGDRHNTRQPQYKSQTTGAD